MSDMSKTDKVEYVLGQGQTRDHHCLSDVEALEWMMPFPYEPSPPCPPMTERQRYNLKRRYGITYKQYKKMYDDQNGGCAICGGFEKVSSYGFPPMLGVDHNKFTGKVRGLLCRQCNAQLHSIEDEQWFLLAMGYLEKFGEEIPEYSRKSRLRKKPKPDQTA